LPDAGDTSPEEVPVCLGLRAALKHFAVTSETQGQAHIKPMHQYIAVRLVLEGGFLPDEITPHPPLRYVRSGSQHAVVLDHAAETSSEKTVIGGLKSKDIDVVVAKEGLGPVVAVSVKGTGKAFRNLTNRMEEAIGDCTNLHIMYPGLVYGFLALIKANRESDPGVERNDVCIDAKGKVVSAIRHYHDILSNLTGRYFVRDEHTRYEAVALTLIEPSGWAAGAEFAGFPPDESPLRVEAFFGRIYRVYDLRYPYMATRMTTARRVEWDAASPALADIEAALGVSVQEGLGYSPRLA
jgi:hypothetical protein